MLIYSPDQKAPTLYIYQHMHINYVKSQNIQTHEPSYMLQGISLSSDSLQFKGIYRVCQEERSIFWEVIVSVILSKKLHTNMCPIPNGFRDRAI